MTTDIRCLHIANNESGHEFVIFTVTTTGQDERMFSIIDISHDGSTPQTYLGDYSWNDLDQFITPDDIITPLWTVTLP